jgi:MFS family permease
MRHRNFRLFLIGQLISVIGTWMQTVAQSWLIYRLTHSSLLLGAVGFAGQIPMVPLGLIGGEVADRYSRQKVVIATQVASMTLAFVLAALTMTGMVRVWHVFVLSALLGIVNSFEIPARQAFTVEMVGKEDLANAIALNSSVFNGARMVGPAIAGILVAAIGEGWCFFVNGVSYIAVIIGLLLMRLPRGSRTFPSGSAMRNILEGFRFIRGARPILAILLLLGLMSFVGMPFSVLMPVFADQVLHGGARGLGILMGATGTGALAGALILTTRSGVAGLGRWVGICCGGFGCSLILFSISRSFWLSVVFLFPTGMFMMLQLASSNTLVQTMSPDALRGRVMAVFSIMLTGMAPVGSMAAGVIAEHLGAPVAVFLGAVACVAGSAVFLNQLPHLRTSARELIAAHGIVERI